jgi:phospholipase D1/2
MKKETEGHHRNIKEALHDARHGGKEDVTSADIKARFEEARENDEERDEGSKDSVAKNAMLGQPSLYDEAWEGDDREEVDLWIQEELYIHAKLLIVDDRISLCGSANINDRSQIGKHDSELAIVSQDTKTIQSTMDGKPYEAAEHAANLRRFLWREHLGLLPPQDLDASEEPNAQPLPTPNDPKKDEWYDFVADPLSDDVWKMWTENATLNTRIFRRLFHAGASLPSR